MTFLQGNMTMSAHVERNSGAGIQDDWGAPEAPIWAPVEKTIPCYAWEKSRKEGQRKKVDKMKVVMLRSLVMMTALGVDLTENDRISRITDRSGNAVFEGPFVVDGGKRLPHHVEWELGEGRIN